MVCPDIKIVSKELDMLGVIDYYSSLRHKRSWRGVGEFEFHISRFDPKLIKIGNIIMLDNKRKNGIITGFKGSFNSGKMDIAVTGTTLDGLSSRRIVLPFEDTLNGGYYCYPYLTTAGVQPSDAENNTVSAETLIKAFARRGFDNGNEVRKFPNLSFIADHCQNAGKKANWMCRYEQLDNVLQEISEYCDIGWEVFPVFSESDKYLAFNVVPGVDRSCSQSINSSVIISKDFDSASDITYSVDVSGYKNIAYAAGKGENAERTVLPVTNDTATPSGYDRFECFEDCGSLEVAETSEHISLEDEGKHKLLDYPKEEMLTATLTTTGTFVCGKDYDLGDLVTVIDRDFSVNQDMRLIEIEECYEPAKMQIRGVLGSSSAHLGRTIRSLLPQIR